MAAPAVGRRSNRSMARPGAFLYYRNASYMCAYILIRTLLSTQEYTYIYGQPCSPFTRKRRCVARSRCCGKPPTVPLGTMKLFDFGLSDCEFNELYCYIDRTKERGVSRATAIRDFAPGYFIEGGTEAGHRKAGHGKLIGKAKRHS